MELYCKACGAYVGAGETFCPTCRRRLIPLTSYDITIDDYAYQPDLDAMATIKQAWPIMGIARYMVIGRAERTIRKLLLTNALKVDGRSRLDGLVRYCGTALGLERLPEVFILNSSSLNAFTFGTDEKPFIVLSSAMLERFDEEELTAAIAHELAHVKSRHLVYHTVAEVLGGGLEISASFANLEIISLPFRLLLLDWLRKSEISADRASLLVVGKLPVVRSLLKKILLSMNPEHGMVYDDGLLESIGELLSTHPKYSGRLEALEEFYRSPEYRRAKEKLEKRLALSKAFVPKCKFCGARKMVTEVFCPSCGRCLV